MDVNEKGTTDDMDWAAMGKEEVQYQQNDADELDICPIDILLFYWKSYNCKIMLRITGSSGLCEDTLEANDFKIYYPDILSLYLIVTIIGVNKSW